MIQHFKIWMRLSSCYEFLISLGCHVDTLCALLFVDVFSCGLKQRVLWLRAEPQNPVSSRGCRAERRETCFHQLWGGWVGLSRTQQWLKKMLYGFTCGHPCMRVFGVHPVAGLNYSASRLFFLLSGEFWFPRASAFVCTEVLQVQMLVRNTYYCIHRLM